MRNIHDTTSAVVVVDGTVEVQQWLDDVLAAARLGSPGDWPHSHSDVPRATVTLDEVAKAIGACFTADGVPWSVALLGLPPLPGEPFPVLAGTHHPAKGSAYHNMLHSLLGDFH
ncbi:hypothetical protein AWW66_17255 [Micromonospora rosaria]|uniref:Uncharacterized protein n=1 Tax=Micromonospora rosaria TaxID=47874 RepID=A0A136PQR0_9ACTN|nr:hypothetical protein [Micromonospora rosaria]KXK60751.1 hypothetical protein AWW66_17255 [Micromonospora rosaria]